MFNNAETIWLTELNLSQLNDVIQLLSICEKNDKGGPLIYSNSLLCTRLPPMNGLIYYQHKLIAFISVYFFYTHACECSLMVSPDYRRRGLAKSLLETMVPLLKSQQMKSIYFSASQAFKLHKFPKLTFRSCEYQLTRTLEEKIEPIPHKLKFRVASSADVNILCDIDQACFSNYSLETVSHRFEEITKSPHYRVLIGELNGKAIAKAHIQWQKNQTSLSDIAVLPEYQRQGFGSEVVQACLIESQQRGFNKTILEVESNNERALKLYLNQGFSINKATNFWEMKI